jgi:hypothetical protein
MSFFGEEFPNPDPDPELMEQALKDYREGRTKSIDEILDEEREDYGDETETSY